MRRFRRALAAAALLAGPAALASPVFLAGQVAGAPRFGMGVAEAASLPVRAPERDGSPADASVPTPGRPRPAPPDAWIAEDKARHLFASLALTAAAFGGARAAGLEWPEAGIAAGALAGGAGVAKELRDRARGRPFSVRDLVWDIVGVGVGLALAERARR